MKELPYFRFTPSEWQNGKISLEEYELQGFFIQVCSYYWVSDCSITLAMLSKKYKYDKPLIEQCLNLGIFSHDSETDFITIHFLNEQFDVLSESRKKRQNAGYKGGMKKGINNSNAKAMLKQCAGYKDKDKDKDKDKEGEEEIPALEIEIKTNLINQNIIPIAELENYMISQEVWVSDLARIHKLSPDYETAIKKSKEFIHLFVEHLRASNEKGWDKSDCFRYCNNWIKIQLAQKQTKTSKKSNITNLTGKEIYEQF